ncbi:MAG TPA: ABC transporter permease [Mediterranea massiliensis]|uniref:ABC transporter permease n=1 Tax=Mediterranea massiliensis TaxID=1841865 RepID=A0A921HXJ1_9BACT|nr:FtsX-like permease family protein [Mediterranea massiliensis]HJF92611.1 ABC transporter permease [Mediterranea massiliensis]
MRLLILSINALLKFRAYTVLNVVGLAVSLACVLTIARYIHQENTVNHCFPDYDRICLVKSIISNGECSLGGYRSGLEDDPAVEEFTAYTSVSDLMLVFGKQKVQSRVFSIDSTFFKMFPYKVLMGSNRIRRPGDVVITRSFWEEVLQGRPVVGGSFTNGQGRKFTIIGVVDAPATKTSWQPQMFMSDEIDAFLLYSPTYALRMVPGYDLKALNQKHGKEVPRNKWATYQTLRYEYLPLSELYFDADLERDNPMYRFGNPGYISVLTAVAFLMGLIGLLNFVNIYTVIMSRRSREFGIKKVFGAGKAAIFVQIYVENMFLAGFALLLCWTILEVTRYLFYNELYIPVTSDVRFDLLASAIVLWGLPLLTTVYPYLKFTRSLPVNSIRAITTSRVSVRSRMVFLGVQYVLTIFIISVSLFFVKQLDYMLHADLGFRTHDIINATMYHNPLGLYKDSKENLLDEGKRQQINRELVNRRMAESTLFEYWNRSSNILLDGGRLENFALERAENGFHQALVTSMTRRTMDMYGLQLVEGRLWNDSVDEALSRNSFKVIINETAKRVLGVKDITREKLQPEDVHFASSWMPDFFNPPCEIVGVIKDFNVRHLAKATMPMVIYYDSEIKWGLYAVTAAYRHEDRARVIRFLSDLYEEATGRTDFEYTLIEDVLAKMYEDDRRVVRIYTLFAGVAILISLLGLLAIALFDISQRRREIGLRKVNGAQARDIYPLLLRKYLAVLGVSALVSVPLSWLAITLYLQGFAHKAPLTPGLFVVAVLVTALLSLLTVMWQVHRAAHVNPAEVIKRE